MVGESAGVSTGVEAEDVHDFSVGQRSPLKKQIQNFQSHVG